MFSKLFKVLTIFTVKLLRFTRVLANLQVGTIPFVLSATALGDAVAHSSRRKALVVGGAEKVVRSIGTHFLAISFIWSVPAVVVAITHKIQRNAHFAGTSKLIDATLLICTSFVFIARVADSAIVIRIALPRFRNAPAAAGTRKLVWIARRVLTPEQYNNRDGLSYKWAWKNNNNTKRVLVDSDGKQSAGKYTRRQKWKLNQMYNRYLQRCAFIWSVVAVSVAVTDPAHGNAANRIRALELIFSASNMLACAT